MSAPDDFAVVELANGSSKGEAGPINPVATRDKAGLVALAGASCLATSGDDDNALGDAVVVVMVGTENK